LSLISNGYISLIWSLTKEIIKQIIKKVLQSKLYYQ
jgi:hypothetical protein